ncbi:MAG: NUDIX hydrolase [Nitrososphaerota archaeon]|nr:NUDIX hydrolase [Nitrososphaerota archaeon]
MATDRKFCRFNADPSAPPFAMRSPPEGGMCISSFVLITERGKPSNVLLGRLDPSARWDHIGALDRERAERNSRGWMIPASHLIVGESPQEAAERVLEEQLEMKGVALSGPRVVSEAYPTTPGGPPHWDIQFIFRGEAPEVGKAGAWKELKFVDVPRLPKSEMARRHEDVLESAGFAFPG